MMADDVSFKIDGLGEVLVKLKAVGDVTRRKAGRSALRKAGLLIVSAAKQNVMKSDDPETARSIASNIAIQWNNRRFRATGDISFRIGVRGGALVPKGQQIPDGAKVATPHWRFLEFGTKSSVAKPFLRPAMSATIDAVTSTFVTQLNLALDKAARLGKTE